MSMALALFENNFTADPDDYASTVQKNKPSQVVFLVPAGLVAGTYNREVRARIGGGLSS